MPAAAAAAEIPEDTPVPKSGKKKLILIGVVVLLVLALAGGGATWWLKKRAAHAAELAGEEDGSPKVVEKKIDIAHPPTFLPLEPFVVNLADRDADRYAQIGITLELESPAVAEQVKAFMPAVRNAILMVIAHKNARDLLDRSGKEDLADEIMREAMRPMGIDVDMPVRLREPVAVAKAATAASAATPAASSSASSPATTALAAASAPESTTAAASASAPIVAAAPASAAASVAPRVAALPAPRADKPRVRGEVTGPIHHVHFSSFIIQ